MGAVDAVDVYWAAREGDALLHSSWLSDAISLFVEAVAYTAAVVLATATVVAVAGLCVATGGAAAVVIGIAVSAAVGVGATLTGAGDALTEAADAIGDFVSAPFVASPQPMATIVTGSSDTHINGRPAARAAGQIDDTLSPQADEAQEDPGFLSQFLQQLWSPTVAAPDPRAVPCEGDKILCKKHSPMPEPVLAEGSSKVNINGQPAVRSGDRSTCEAKVSKHVSPNVRIGGDPVVVREIRSGKPGWMRLASMLSPGRAVKSIVTAGLRASLKSVFSSLGRNFGKSAPCLVINAGMGLGVSYATARLTQAGMAVAHPVHAAMGSKFLMDDEDLDIDLPASFPLRVQRVYNSRDLRQESLFGIGWSTGYEVEIVRSPASNGEQQHVYIDEQGRKVELGDLQAMDAFHDAALGIIVRRAKEGPIVIETLDGVYRMFEPDPHHDTRLRLALLGDRNSNVLHLTYDAQGRIERIAEDDGPGALALHYAHAHPRRVAQIDYLHHGELIRTVAAYAYSQDAQLTEVHNAAAQLIRRFAYDTGHRLSMHETASGQQCHYDWQAFTGGPDGEDHEHWRVIRYHSNAGDDVHIAYDLATGTTTTLDHLGRTTVRHWVDTFHITDYTDEVGITTRFEWSERGQLLACIDAEGGHWRYSYDDWGNCIEERDPLGHTTVRDYIGARALPKHETDPEGNTWHYRYDAHGNLSEQIDPAGQRTRFIHDDHGRLIHSEDALGNTTGLRWNERGLLQDHQDPHGQLTRFTWDEMGHLASVTNPLGETTRYLHSPAGHLIKTILSDGREYHDTRDRAGLLIRHANPAGHTTTWTRAVTGKVTERRDPHGHKVRFEYDPYGRLKTLTNENGQTYRFTWDPADRLIEQTGLDGSRHRYHYNTLNHLTAAEHHPGYSDQLEAQSPATPLTTHFERDPLGRLCRKITAEATTEYTWNRNSDIICVCRTDTQASAPPYTLRFDYDKLGHLTAEHTEHDLIYSTLAHTYDALENLTTTVLPDGRRIDRHYDLTGHLLQIALDGDTVTDFTRDALHRETARTQGLIKTLTHYDRSGRITRLSQQLANPNASLPTSALSDIQYDYDHADRLTTVTRQRHGGRTGFGLDGRPVHPRNPLPPPQRQHYRYDPADRLTHSLYPQHNHPGETFHYDPASNLLNTDTPTINAPHIPHNRIRAYKDKRYHWDPFGRLARKRTGTHTEQHFHYDSEHRLTRVDTTTHTGTWRTAFNYDPLGRRIAKTHTRTDHPDTQTHTRFHWDGLHLLQEEDRFTNTLYLYTAPDSHEPLARVNTDLRPLLQEHAGTHPQGQALAPELQAIILPKATDALPIIPTASGGNGHWGALTKTNRAALPARIDYFHTTLNGAPEALSDQTGEIIWRATYSAWGNLLQEEGQIKQNLRFQGQSLDRETGLHYNTFRYYDPDIGRFTTPDPIGLDGGLNLYQYAPNPIMWIDPWGWVALDAPGYNLYHIINVENNTIHYVGITKNTRTRTTAHRSNRLGNGFVLVVEEKNLTYAQARGYEQADIKHHKTTVLRLQERGLPLVAGSGNRQLSFSENRNDKRARAFKKHEAQRAKLNSCR